MSTGTASIPRRALLVCEPFGARLSAERVAAAIAAGLLDAAQPPPDSVSLPLEADALGTAALLEHDGFPGRLRAARAVVLAVRALREQTLQGSAAFEVATLARQSGVPCYAVAAENRLSAFDLRILDVQIVLEARGVEALRRAGTRLAALI